MQATPDDEFVAFYRREQVRLMESPGAWVYKVATNLATSVLRRRRYERAAVARTPADIVATGSADRGGDSDVLEVLRTLPRRQREAICYRFILDLSVQQTSHEMNCAAGTVRALTAQGVARRRLTLSTAGGD